MALGPSSGVRAQLFCGVYEENTVRLLERAGEGYYYGVGGGEQEDVGQGVRNFRSGVAGGGVWGEEEMEPKLKKPQPISCTSKPMRTPVKFLTINWRKRM